jgi:hypothetical protein
MPKKKPLKEIYRSITPRKDPRMPPQNVKAVLVAEDDRGRRALVVIQFDTSYADQSCGTIGMLWGRKFETLLTLDAHEIPFVADWHDLGAPKHGEILRHGKLFETSLSLALHALAERGFYIVGDV